MRARFPVLDGKPADGSAPRAASLAGALGADVLLCPFADPWFAEPGVPTVCVVHDVERIERPPGCEEEDEPARRAGTLGRVARVSDLVVAASVFTRERGEREWGFPDGRTAVVPGPAPARPAGPATGADGPSLARDGLPPGRYLLCPAAGAPLAEAEGLVRAYAEHRRRLRDRAAPALVLAGAAEPHGDWLRGLARGLGLGESVRVVGADGEPLWRDARAVVLPWRADGAGLALLEALRLGKPVLASSGGCLPELAADAALYVDAEVEAALGEALDEIARDDALLARLAAASRARGGHFRAERVARRYLELLDRVVAEAPPPAPGGLRAPGPPRAVPARAAAPVAVSVVMPSYQDAPYIERSIRSVLDQDVPAHELIVCDGGSADGTVEILERYGDRLTWISEPDRGQADAVNKAIAMSSGNVIGWLNSDDVYLPGALRFVARLFEANPALDAVYGVAYHVAAGDAFLGVYEHLPWDAARLRERCFLSQPATFFRRELIERCGGLDVGLRYCMDYELWLRFAERTGFLYTPVVLAGSRTYPETKSLSEREAMIREILDMLHRRDGGVAESWLVTFCSIWLDEHRAYDRADPVGHRRYLTDLLWLVPYAFARWETELPPELRASLVAQWRRAQAK